MGCRPVLPNSEIHLEHHVNKTSQPKSRARRALVPICVLAVAGGAAVGSSAVFTSTSSNAVSAVTSGTLAHFNSAANSAIFSIDGLKPGDSLTGELSLMNTGNLPAAFSLTEESSTNEFTADNLHLKIEDKNGGDVIYDGTFGGLTDGAKTPLGNFAVTQSETYAFTVTLDIDADNADQGKSATAVYKWDAVQLEPQHSTFTDGIFGGTY
jgi:hypothetical protein